MSLQMLKSVGIHMLKSGKYKNSMGQATTRLSCAYIPHGERLDSSKEMKVQKCGI